MNLATGILITQPKVYPRVMTEIVIKAVEKLAESQGFKTLKKFNRKKREMLFPDDDILAGVEWVHNYNETYDIQEYEKKNISIIVRLIYKKMNYKTLTTMKLMTCYQILEAPMK